MKTDRYVVYVNGTRIGVYNDENGFFRHDSLNQHSDYYECADRLRIYLKSVYKPILSTPRIIFSKLGA